VKLAFIVVTYNAERYIGPLLRTLRDNTDLSGCAVIVVDNASGDGTLGVLREAAVGWAAQTGGGQMHVLPQADNTGFAGGCNIGLAEARRRGAAYAMLLNQDLELRPGWLPPLLAVMDGRPDVAAAQPIVLLHREGGGEGELVNTAGNAVHFCGFGYCGHYREPAERVFPNRAEVRSVPYASGAALLLRLEAVERAGGFDERLFLYHEDCDLQIRLRQLGYECVVVAASRVSHKYDAGFASRKMRYLERNRWFVLLKDWPLSRLLVAAPALAGVEAAVLVLAARSGWLDVKLGTYAEVARALPGLLRDRRAVQARRTPAANDGDHLTGAIRFEGFDHPIVTKLANPILSAYWTAARRVFGVR
jgi:GT2 family glycosyltransferase